MQLLSRVFPLLPPPDNSSIKRNHSPWKLYSMVTVLVTISLNNSTKVCYILIIFFKFALFVHKINKNVISQEILDLVQMADVFKVTI